MSVVELIVALTLSAVAATAAYSVLEHSRRAFLNQAVRMELDQEVRAAVSIVAGELRPLDSSDPDGSDIVDMSPASLTYRATRSVRFLCLPADTVTMQVTLAESPRFGDAALSTAPRALLLYTAGDRWLRVTAVGRLEAAVCWGSQPGVRLRVADVSPSDLTQVEGGAPLLSQETLRIQPYRDGDGVYWLGARAPSEGGGWSDIQPFAGPVAAGGLELEYFDAAGGTASVPERVSRIGLAVTGRATGGLPQTLRLSTQVALRNSRK